jgi:predicted nucleic acid-binding protein
MIFVDSGAWIALLNQKDPHHDDAVAIYNDLVQQNAQLLTTDYVIDETVTRLRYDWSHSGAVQFLNFIKRTKEATEEIGALTIAAINSTSFQEAERLFRQYNTATLSFTDCTSFVICQQYKISEAFAFDQHFTMMGITLRG